jgi:Sec-independent protein secretion pathway component TatC
MAPPRYLDHYLAEGRHRLLHLLGAGGLALLASYHYRFALLHLLTRPLAPLGGQLQVVGVAEGVLALLRVTLWGAALALLPLLLYHLGGFWLPGCYGAGRRRWLRRGAGWLLLLGGLALLLGHLVLPPLWGWLASSHMPPWGATPVGVVYHPRLASYLGGVLGAWGAGLLLGHLPLLAPLLMGWGIATPGGWARGRRLALPGALLLAGAVAPPAPLLQGGLALGLLGVYEAGLYLGLALPYGQ